MDAIKYYIINLIFICFFIQIISIIVSTEKHKKIFKLVGAIMFTSALLKFPSQDFKFNFNIPDMSLNEYVYDETSIKNRFSKDISEIIKKDLYETFNINAKVNAKTDLNMITFTVTVDKTSEKYIEKISGYIREKYCTKSDEVYINYEPYT